MMKAASVIFGQVESVALTPKCRHDPAVKFSEDVLKPLLLGGHSYRVIRISEADVLNHDDWRRDLPAGRKVK